MQIPKGDNLGNVLPQVGRTRISGNDGGIGQAMRGMGQQLNGIALRLEAEKEQVNQIEMRNAVLNRQKQVDALKIDINDRVDKGELSPEKAVEEYGAQMAKMPRQTIDGLNNKQQETLNYYYNETDYRGQMQAFGIYQNGLKVKAKTAISEYARLANEDPSNDINTTLTGIDSEAMNNAFTTAFGLAAPEQKAAFKRELLFNNLQNKSAIAADNGDYKALKQFKSDVMSGDFYKGVLQNDDRVKLAHNAKSAMKGLEAQWREAKNQLRADIAYSYQNILTASANGDLMDNPYSKKDYISVYGEKEGERRYSEVTMWQTEVAPKILTYNDMTIDEIGQDVAKSKPVVADSKPLYKVSDSEGMIEQGNIDLSNRPIVKNDDGSISTVRSMSIGVDGKEYLIPTVSPDGKVLTDDEAIQLFNKTKKHLGVFDTPETATAYAEKLHNQQEQFYLEPNISKTGEGYAARDKVYKFKLAAAQQVLNERATKPFNAAVRSGLFKPFNSANPDEITNELARRYAALPELREKGINAPLVSKEEADLLAQDVRGSQNVDTQMRLIKGLGEKLPAEAVSNIAAQIAPNSAAVAYAAMLLNAPQSHNNTVRYKEIPVSESVKRAFDPKLRDLPRPKEEVMTSTIDTNKAAETILKGDQLLNPTEEMKKQGIQPIAIPSDGKLKEEFNDYVGNAFQHNPQMYQLSFGVYRAAYASLAYSSGNIDDIKSDTVSSDIAKKAALMATGGIYKGFGSSFAFGFGSDGHDIVMPYGMDESTFKDKYTKSATEALKTAGLNSYGVGDTIPISISLGTYQLMNGSGKWVVNPKTQQPIIVRVE